MKDTLAADRWSSRLSYILATTGAAIGLGNIWKFPYIAGENGGGAFVLVYLLFILIIGIPLLMTESLIGRHGRLNPSGAMREAAVKSARSSRWQLIGAGYILCGFLILSYYSVIAGWALDYVFQAMFGHFTQATPEHINYLFERLVSNPWSLLLWHSLIMLSTVTVVALGVHQGLERSVRLLLPTMFALLLVVMCYSMTTGYFWQGVLFLFQPNFADLSAKGILIALGHAFFTLSLATGSIMMYGAYIPKKISIGQSAAYIAGADTLVALLAGMAIFPIVFQYQLEPSAGPGLIFKTLPIAFGQIPYGEVLASVFFIMLVFAAFTSAISLLEPTVAWLIEHYHWRRIPAAMAAGSVVWLLGLGTVFSFNLWKGYTVFDMTFFDLLDYLTANIIMPIGGILVAIFAAWFLKQSIVLQELNLEAKHILYRSWWFCLAFITPVAVGIVFLHVIGLI